MSDYFFNNGKLNKRGVLKLVDDNIFVFLGDHLGEPGVLKLFIDNILKISKGESRRIGVGPLSLLQREF